MTAILGERITTTVFGESHGKGIGVVIDGLPPGEKIDMDELMSFLNRRAPGKSDYTTKRREDDIPEFLSGVIDNTIVGSPVCAIIRNNDARSVDYNNLRDVPRPSHADYVSYVKYEGHMDMRGSGPFSGRITAPLCIAGGIALQILKRRGVTIAAHLSSVGGIVDDEWDDINPNINELEKIAKNEFPVINNIQGEKMKELIHKIREEGDSIGGEITCMAVGLPVGIGEPNYSSFESMMARAIFSVPGIRGISFGTGFGAANMKGSEHNDEFELVDGRVRTITNHSGGVVGGITNGMPMKFKVCMKPASSISKTQKSFSITEKSEKDLTVEGRHDPCIAIRAVPVIEAVCALVILDLWR